MPVPKSNRWHPVMLPDDYIRKMKQDLGEVEAQVESKTRYEPDPDSTPPPDDDRPDVRLTSVPANPRIRIVREREACPASTPARNTGSIRLFHRLFRRALTDASLGAERHA